MRSGKIVLQKDDVNDRSIRQQTDQPYSLSKQIVQHMDDLNPNGWNGHFWETDRSPIILTDKAPVTINYKTRPGETRPVPGFRGFSPIIMSYQGTVTVNYEIAETRLPSTESPSPPPNTGKDLCLLANTMVQTPSGVVMSYLKFKMISSYLPEDVRSDVRIILDNKNMSYKQFQETLRVYGCNDLQDADKTKSGEESTAATGFVTLSDGVTRMKTDDYRTIVISVINGSETLIVPGLFSAKYSTHRSLLTDQLPELIPSAFVATPVADEVVTPFSLYRAVEKDLVYQKPSSLLSSVDRIDQIRWHDGKTVDVQTVRNVIDALRSPEKISYVFSNDKRVPFVQVDKKESLETYDDAKDKIAMDIGCGGKLVPLTVFNDIATAVRLPNGTYNRFKIVFEDDIQRKRLPNDNYNEQNKNQVKTPQNSDKFADNIKEYVENSIHVVKKHPTDNQLNEFRPISTMEKSMGSDNNDNITIRISSEKGVNKIFTDNLMGSIKPLIYDITDKPIDSENVKNISLTVTDYLPYLSTANLNTTNHRETINSQTNNNSNKQPVTVNNNNEMKNTYITNNTSGIRHINYSKDLTKNNFDTPETYARNISNNEMKHLNNNLNDHTGNLIHVINKRSIDNKLNDDITISTSEISEGLDNNGSLTIRISSQEGTYEICILNLFSNAPLKYNITEKSMNLQDMGKNMLQTTSYLESNNSQANTYSVEQPITIDDNNKTINSYVVNNILNTNTNINRELTESDIPKNNINYDSNNQTTNKNTTLVDGKSRETDNILGITGSGKILIASPKSTKIANNISKNSNTVPETIESPTVNDNKNSIEDINRPTKINLNNITKSDKTKTDINEKPNKCNNYITNFDITKDNHDTSTELTKNNSDSKTNSEIKKQTSMPITSNTTKVPERSSEKLNVIPRKNETSKINDYTNFSEATNSNYLDQANTISNENPAKNNDSKIINPTVDKINSQTNPNRIEQPVMINNSTGRTNTSNTKNNITSIGNNVTQTNVGNNSYNQILTENNALVEEKPGSVNNNVGITGSRNSSTISSNTNNVPESNKKNSNATPGITEISITNNSKRNDSKTTIESPGKSNNNIGTTTTLNSTMANNLNFTKNQNNTQANINRIEQPITINENNGTTNNPKANNSTINIEPIKCNNDVSITRNTTLTKDKSEENNNNNGTTGTLDGTKTPDNDLNDSSEISKPNVTPKMNQTEEVDNPTVITPHSIGLKNESSCVKTDNEGKPNENNDTKTRSTTDPIVINQNIPNISKDGNNSQVNIYEIGQPVTKDNNNRTINSVVKNNNNCNVEPLKNASNTNIGNNIEISTLTGNTTLIYGKPTNDTGITENGNNTVTNPNTTKILERPLNGLNETLENNESNDSRNHTGGGVVNATLSTQNHKGNMNESFNITDTDVGENPRESTNARTTSIVNTIIFNPNYNKGISTNFDDISEKITLTNERSNISNNTAKAALNFINTGPNNNSILKSDSKIINIIVY